MARTAAAAQNASASPRPSVLAIGLLGQRKDPSSSCGRDVLVYVWSTACTHFVAAARDAQQLAHVELLRSSGGRDHGHHRAVPRAGGAGHSNTRLRVALCGLCAWHASGARRRTLPGGQAVSRRGAHRFVSRGDEPPRSFLCGVSVVGVRCAAGAVLPPCRATRPRPGTATNHHTAVRLPPSPIQASRSSRLRSSARMRGVWSSPPPR